MAHKFLKTKKDITAWLDEYHGSNDYSLKKDSTYGYVIDVEDCVDFGDLMLDHIPVKFDKVGGVFFCHNNNLTNLEFAPDWVGGSFRCENNLNLLSLVGGPTFVEGDFDCSYCGLKDLVGAPIEVFNDFRCYNNKLTSLKGAPATIKGNFWVANNLLKNLQFCPDIVKGSFDCSANRLNSLEFCPRHVGSAFDCFDNEKLGERQYIYEFDEIYPIHLKEKNLATIKKERSLLSKNLKMQKAQLPNSSANKAIHKI